MLAGPETLKTIANHWLARFESALRTRDKALLESLFQSESHWRDVLALTWRIRTVSGTQPIAAALELHAEQQFTIGVVSGVPQPVVARQTLMNVPEQGFYNWDPGAFFGIYRPDTFWFK